MPRTLALIVALTAALVASGRAQQPSSLANLKTTAEASDFKSTSTYDDVVKFMKAVDEASPLVFYTTYGTTYEGRPMPMAVVGTGLKDASPASVKGSGKLRVHIQANIHAGEVEGKESAQILLRELAMGQHADWLRSMVLLVTPIFNADGNEKFALNNRGRQNGPINGQGTRANGQNLNINRDFMKLETPEGRAFAKLWNDYDPQVGFDLHTSDGSAARLLPDVRPAAQSGHERPDHEDHEGRVVSVRHEEHQVEVRLGHVLLRRARRRWAAGADAAVIAAPAPPVARPGAVAGPEPPAQLVQPLAAPSRVRYPHQKSSARRRTPGTMRAWNTFEHVPRYHNNYVGMRNRFALLSEAYAYATFEDRIKATNYFVEEALNFAQRERGSLEEGGRGGGQGIHHRHDRRHARADQARRRHRRSSWARSRTRSTRSATATMTRRKDVVHEEQMIDMLWFEPSKTEDVPHEYYVPASATKALDLLALHGIQMHAITAPVRGVEQFTITSNTQRPANPNSIDTGAHGLRIARRHVGGRRGRHGARRRLGRADEPAARAARLLPAGADVRRRAHGVELSG